jgi:hypothetical protein
MAVLLYSDVIYIVRILEPWRGFGRISSGIIGKSTYHMADKGM